jgi:YhgE/Pip-like protein
MYMFRQIFKNKLLIIVPILALALVFIFSLTLFPTVQPQPENLPVAIVNEDKGVEIPDQPAVNMGQTILDMAQAALESAEDEEPAVKWIVAESAKAVQEGMDNQEYYAALVIPADFSAKQASLRTDAPSSPELQIYVNQGMNAAAANMAAQVLNGMVDNINNNVRTELLEGFEAQGATLTVEQAASIAVPITKTVTNVNEVGENSAGGNAPVSLFQPLWIACLASSAILFIAVSKMTISNRKEKLASKIAQIIMGVLVALFIGFGLTWLAEAMVGLNIPDFTDTALFLSITAFSFILMILAVLSLIGFKGIALFALLLFFGAPLLAMAPEMMSAFYRDWIYPWLPMRFMIEGLREIFYFGQGLVWNTPLSVLVWIGVVSLIVILLTALKRTKSKSEATS